MKILMKIFGKRKAPAPLSMTEFNRRMQAFWLGVEDEQYHTNVARFFPELMEDPDCRNSYEQGRIRTRWDAIREASSGNNNPEVA